MQEELLELRRDYAEKFPSLFGHWHPHQFFLTTEEMHALLGDPIKLGSDSIGELREVTDHNASTERHVVHANVDVETVITKQDMLDLGWPEHHIRWLLSQVGVPDDAEVDHTDVRLSVRHSMQRKSRLLSQRDSMYQGNGISTQKSNSNSDHGWVSGQPAEEYDGPQQGRRAWPQSDGRPLHEDSTGDGTSNDNADYTHRGTDKQSSIASNAHMLTVEEILDDEDREARAIPQMRIIEEIKLLRSESCAMQTRLAQTENLNHKLLQTVEAIRDQMEQMHAVVISDSAHVPTTAARPGNPISV